MNNYTFNSIVSHNEADALKEMIFNRVKQRAELFADETNNSYTSNVHNDIMNLARLSVNAEKNPFANIIKGAEEEVVQEITAEPVAQNEPENVNGVGFPQRKTRREIKDFVEQYTKTNANVALSEINNTMAQAHDQLSRKQTFIGAIDFLNAQATISLIKSKGKKFDAFA